MFTPEGAVVLGKLLDGFVLNLQIFVITLIGSLPLGLIIMFGSRSRLGLRVFGRMFRPIRLLTRGFVFLKKRFSYGEGGKVVVRPCRSSVTRQRRKLKKQAALVAQGIMTVEKVNQSYQSWRGSMKRLCAHVTVKSMDALYKELFG